VSGVPVILCSWLQEILAPVCVCVRDRDCFYYIIVQTYDVGLTPRSVPVMMMIAFVTLKSSLVPLMEGVCSSNPCGFEIWEL